MNKMRHLEIDPRFLPHNTHHLYPSEFGDRDPQLSLLSRLPLVHRFELLDALPTDAPGIYSVTGGRQLGKTTLMKQWMLSLVERGTNPEAVVYLTGELIDDHHSLVALVTNLLSPKDGRSLQYLCIDEVTYIREWDRGIKYLADAGLLRNVVLLLTGSDSVLIRDARMRLPGRRGGAAISDFRIFPLSFHDVVRLTARLAQADFDATMEGGSQTQASLDTLARAFERYLLTGGYLTAINSLEATGTITPATYGVYCDWIRGDILKRGRQERYLREVLSAVVKRLGSQVTWNALAGDLSIDHPATVAEYIDLLVRMDVLVVIPALAEHLLAGAPKKARKVVFADPFIFHAVRSWVEPSSDPFGDQAVPCMANPEWAGRLAELSAATHYSRRYPTYYIKAEGEVDIAWVGGGTFHPIEVKWTGQVRSKDLKQVRKYADARILSRESTDTLHSLPNEFLPLHLLRMGPSPYLWP